MTDPLDPAPETIRAWGEEVLGWAANYLGTIRERRLYPKTTSREIRAGLNSELPQDSGEFSKALDAFVHAVVDLSRHNAHPRMFGYVQPPGTAVAALADLLASTLNANLTAWRSAPAAVEVERLTIEWIRQILGLEQGAAGLFVSGGSMANLSALATARRNRVPANIAENGAQSFDRTLRVYASTETHHSTAKAAGLLGIGRQNVRLIPVDDHFRIRIDELAAEIKKDRENGHFPFCVVGNAGTVATGSFDPLGEIAEVAAEFGLWMHVDACYGGFAAMAKSAENLFRDLKRADSVALDPHKWLYLPADCGCVLYKNPETARATFAHDAEYTRVMGQEADEAFAFWDYGPELSRRFRALKVWMLFHVVGRARLSQAIENDLACARHLAQLIQSSDEFELMAPVELSICCFRHVPAALKNGDAKEVDAYNERLLVALQRDGSSYLSNASINGRFSLRGCVMNYRSTPRDMEVLLDDLRRVAAGLR